MNGLERNMYWAAVGLLAAGTVVAAVLPGSVKRWRALSALPAFIIITIGIAIRWAATGHARAKAAVRQLEAESAKDGEEK